MLSPDVLDDVTEGLVLPSEWAPASVSEFVSWPFKWSRLETTFDGDGVAVVKHLVSFSHPDGEGTVERELESADYKALRCGAALECALSSVERGVAAMSLVEVKRGAAQQLKNKTAISSYLAATMTTLQPYSNRTLAS